MPPSIANIYDAADPATQRQSNKAIAPSGLFASRSAAPADAGASAAKLAAAPAHDNLDAQASAAQHWNTVRAAVAASAFQEDSGGEEEDKDDIKKPAAKRRRAARSVAPTVTPSDDNEPVSDEEQKRLEKRREKNRRTARVSRERRNAEVQAMKLELEQKTAEVSRLQAVIAEKDKQLNQLSQMLSANRGSIATDGAGAGTAQGGSESAVLNLVTEICSYLLHNKDPPAAVPSQPPTAPACSAMECTEA